MVTAFVLINVVRNRIAQVADALATLPDISEVYSLSGRYDLLAVIRVTDVDQLSRIVTEELLLVEGITNSETMLAFRAYSRFDLERLFSIGVEGA